MVAKEQRRAETDFSLDAGSGRNAAPICRADDLKGFLQLLSNQIADADRRHSLALRDMHERLGRLGDQTGTLKASLPKEFSADLERLEDGMATLAQRIAESDQARQPEPAVNDIAETLRPAPVDPSPAASSAWSDASRGTLLSPPPALRSAVSTQSTNNWSRTDGNVRSVDVELDASRAHGDEPWDSQSADALARLYETGDAALEPRSEPARVELGTAHGEHLPAATPVIKSSVAQSVISQAAAMPFLTPIAGLTPQAASINPLALELPAMHVAPPAPAKDEIEREWLEARLSDVALRIEQSLADLRPEHSFVDFGRRFDQLEEKWSIALTDVATRSDVEGLRLVEAHIAELTARIEETQSQLARLDFIEGQLNELGKQLTDEQVIRLFGNLVPTEADLTQFAETAAERVASRMIAVMPHAAASGPATAHNGPAPLASEAFELAQADSTERLSALQEMLAGFIDERRRGEAETTEALETMQHAMQHVLDRVDAIDQARAAHQPMQLQVPLAATQNLTAPQSMGSATTYAAVDGREAFEDAKTAVKAAAAAIGRGGQPRAQSETEPHRRVEPVLQAAHPADDEISDRFDVRAAAARAASSHSAGGQSAAAPAAGDRRSVVEMARRTAEKSKSAAASEMPEPSKAKGVRDRILGVSDATNKSGSVRPALLLVPSIAALLMAGFWFLSTPKRGSVKPMAAVIEDTVPGVAGRKPDEKSPSSPALFAPGLAPAGELETTPVPAPAPAKPGLKGLDERSELPSMRSRSSSEVSETSSIGRNQPSSSTGAPNPGPRVVAGPFAGITIQQTGRPPSLEEAQAAREKMQLAALSQRTAQNAAQTSAVPPTAIPASIRESDLPAQAEVPAGDGKTVLELPPALVGPLSLRLAAAKGDPSAQFEVAARFAEGKGIKQDFAQAAAWYQRSAAQGLATAQYRLAALYERGLGVKADPARARLWYTRAAEQGNVKAMHNLAVLSASREQGSADYPTAVQWFSEAAERGLSDSQYNLGVLFESGLGVPKNMIAAYKWYAISARGGDSEAIRRQEILKKKLDAITLQTAEEAIQSWRARPIEGLANDAVAAGTAWKGRVNAQNGN